MGRAVARRIGDRWHGADRLAGVAVVAAVAIRLAVAGFLIAGPATDEPGELAGWDAERFQEIAARSEPAWSGQPVEYPPGSVVVLDRLAGRDVVATHRRLVALSVVVDLATVAALHRRVGPGPARAFLLLGLPLVPLGYQRLDTLVTAVAVVAALALLAPLAGPRPAARREDGGNRGTGRPPGPRRRTGPAAADWLAALAIAAGALTKIWPLVLVVGAVAIGRWRAAVGAVALTALAGAVWLGLVGHGLDPLDQVLSLRGATGWHVESLPGALVALTGGAEARLELDAFRIGTLRPGLVTGGRLGAVLAMGSLAVAGRSRAGGRAGDPQRILAVTTLGATAALLASAPLLSPQFLVWTTPSAALLVAGPARGIDAGGIVEPLDRLLLGPIAAAAVLTGFTLTAFGPAGLDATLPAALLTVRNLLLLAIAPLGIAALVSTPASTGDRRPDRSPDHPDGPDDLWPEATPGAQAFGSDGKAR